MPVVDRFAPTSSAFDMGSRVVVVASVLAGAAAGKSTTTFPISLELRELYATRPGTATFASGSSRWRRSSQTRRPASCPSLRWSRSRNSERRTSSPPPAPKTAPIRPPIATTSLRVHGAIASPARLYSALIPAT